MSIFYLIVIILFCSGHNISSKAYNNQSNNKGAYYFSAIKAFAACLFFVITSKNMNFDMGILPYSILFGISYGTAGFSFLKALKYGPLSLSSLIVSYSMIIPTVYGLIFLKEPASLGFYPGFILLLISFYLTNKKSKDEKKISLKWIFYIMLSALGNGFCSVSQKMQQVAFNGAYKNEFMILALIIAAVPLFMVALIYEKNDIKPCTKKAITYAGAAGFMNGVVNLFVMILSGLMATSVMFPLISAGGLILTYILSKVLYKEKLTKRQFTAFLLGICSIILLNI